MTAIDYIQLRAFARYDGLKLFGLWIASFACYMVGLREPGLDVVGLVLALVTPFYAARLLRRFRDEGLEGVVSFGRGWAYVLFLFFYASLLFALAQFVYFTYIDKGYFMEQIAQMFTELTTAQAMQQLGMAKGLAQTIADLSQMRPIDLVLNIMTSNLLIGLVIGLPIGIMAHRSSKPLPPASPQKERPQQ